MIVRGNDLYVRRNETFTIDRTIVNKDGSPYIISSEFTNPYYLFTITSERYSTADRYVANFWINLKDVVRFNETNFKIISSDDLTEAVKDGVRKYLYKIESTNEYKYFDNVDAITLTPYENRFTIALSQDITKDWIEQNYLYSLKLVSGKSTTEYLINTYEGLLGVKPSVDLADEDLYEIIKEQDNSLLKNVDLKKPLVSYDVVKSIADGKIIVQSDLYGGL